MKKCLLSALVMAVCLMLSGCVGLPAAREMGDMALLRTIGVDPTPVGVVVTGSTGPRAKGIQAEEEPALVLTAASDSLSGACLAMQGQSDSYVFFGYVDQLLLGEELAGEGVRPVLDYFARDVELGLGTQLWLVRDATAQDAVSSGGEEGADSRLETLQNDSKLGIAAISRTAGEVYTDLLEWGCAFVPALTPAGEDKSVLTERGYGILQGDTLAGFLEGEEAKGLELLTGGPSTDNLTVELPGNRVSVRLTSARTTSRLEFQGETPSALTVACRVEARLSEYQGRPDSGELEQLEAALEAQAYQRLEQALEQLQVWGADCTGLGAQAAIAHPGKWQAIQGDWPQWFSRLPVEIRVEVRIQV